MRQIFFAVLFTAAFVTASTAQEYQVNEDQLIDVYPGAAYSPYAGRTFLRAPALG